MPASALGHRLCCRDVGIGLVVSSQARVGADGTDSSAPGCARGVLAGIASGVSGWVGPESAVGTLSARPGLHLVIRAVATEADATEGQTVLDRHIAAVPGLLAPPALDDPDLVEKRAKWRRAAATRLSAWQTAHAQAEAVAAEVTGLVPPGAPLLPSAPASPL